MQTWRRLMLPVFDRSTLSRVFPNPGRSARRSPEFRTTSASPNEAVRHSPTRQHKSEVRLRPATPKVFASRRRGRQRSEVRGQTAEVPAWCSQDIGSTFWVRRKLKSGDVEFLPCIVSGLRCSHEARNRETRRGGFDVPPTSGSGRTSAWQAEVRHRRSERNARPMSNTLLLIGYTL
jgi:hypothetical protein